MAAGCCPLALDVSPFALLSLVFSSGDAYIFPPGVRVTTRSLHFSCKWFSTLFPSPLPPCLAACRATLQTHSSLQLRRPAPRVWGSSQALCARACLFTSVCSCADRCDSYRTDILKSKGRDYSMPARGGFCEEGDTRPARLGSRADHPCVAGTVQRTWAQGHGVTPAIHAGLPVLGGELD